jgi:hypothetical protein
VAPPDWTKPPEPAPDVAAARGLEHHRGEAHRRPSDDHRRHRRHRGHRGHRRHRGHRGHRRHRRHRGHRRHRRHRRHRGHRRYRRPRWTDQRRGSRTPDGFRSQCGRRGAPEPVAGPRPRLLGLGPLDARGRRRHRAVPRELGGSGRDRGPARVQCRALVLPAEQGATGPRPAAPAPQRDRPGPPRRRLAGAPRRGARARRRGPPAGGRHRPGRRRAGRWQDRGRPVPAHRRVGPARRAAWCHRLFRFPRRSGRGERRRQRDGDAHLLRQDGRAGPGGRGLVVDPPALCPGGDGCTAPAPAWPPLRERAEERAQRELLGVGRGRVESLGGAGLADDAARPAFGDPEPHLEPPDGTSTAVRGQKFPSASSFSIALSSSASASNLFRRAFSTSSSFRRFASFAFMPP